MDEEAEDQSCPTCNSIVQEDEQECYLCGMDLLDTGLNYDLEDSEDGEYDFG